ncbi:MAG TPA: PspA/IM30 family protein [Thermomicrobiales bacterium]|nr:PspA/IM30 family protein [Thermomicrobiales bacterium]
MPGLSHRFGKLVKTSMDSLLSPPEDPRDVYADALERQRALLDDVRRALLDIGAAKQRLIGRIAEAEVTLPLLQQQARTALAAGREDLARLALQRRQFAANEMQTLERQVVEVEQEEQRLALVEQRLAAQLDAISARQQVIAARHTAVDAQVRIGEALSGVSDELTDVAQDLSRTEQETALLQARASAITDLVDSGSLASADLSGFGPFDQPASFGSTHEIERDLEALRRELATGG